MSRIFPLDNVLEGIFGEEKRPGVIQREPFLEAVVMRLSRI